MESSKYVSNRLTYCISTVGTKYFQQHVPIFTLCCILRLGFQIWVVNSPPLALWESPGGHLEDVLEDGDAPGGSQTRLPAQIFLRKSQKRPSYRRFSQKVLLFTD